MSYKTIDNYTVEIKYNGNDAKIITRSNINSKNSANITHFFEKSPQGFYEARSLSPSNIEKVVENIIKFGVTKGLYFDSSKILIDQVNEEDIQNKAPPLRHKKTQNEQNFTSTGQKLSAHWPIFQKYKDTGFGSIIRATMTLHQVCASSCSFCSTINRTRKDAISLDEAKDFIIKLDEKQAFYNKQNFAKYNEKYLALTGSDIKLRGLILSGGGQPNLWPHFSEFVNWLSNRDIELGLITNGFPKHVQDDVYKNFRWIRLSITPEDASPFYPNQKFNEQRIPKSILENNRQTFGLSYVYGPWTTDELIARIDLTANAWGADYVRMLTDCNLPRQMQLNAHADLAERLFRMGLIDPHGNPKSKIFHQLKFHSCSSETEEIWQDDQCKLQVYNTFWDTTGHEANGTSYCYPCDSVTVLEEPGNNAERRFNPKKWGTVTNNEVNRLYTEPVTPYFNPNENCKACLFVNNNKEVNKLIALKELEFRQIKPSSNMDHVNFP